MHNPPLLSLVKRWTPRGEPALLARTRIFDLTQQRWVSATDPDRAGDFVCLTCPDWANVIALTPESEVVMIEQFRHGVREVTLEIPGGIIDDGEDPAAACGRELLEETGYAGERAGIIGTVSANPAIQTNRVHTALIRNCRLAGAQALDEREEIGVRLFPLAEVADLLRAGVIHHALVVAAFQHLWLRGRSLGIALPPL